MRTISSNPTASPVFVPLQVEPWSESIVTSIAVADCVRADLNFPPAQCTSPTYRRHSAPVVVETSRPMDAEPVSARSTNSVASNGAQETVDELQAQITELKRLEKTVKCVGDLCVEFGWLRVSPRSPV